jgi:hypothetical protein
VWSLCVGLPRDPGATADTPVRAVPVDQNDMIIDHLAIELDSAVPSVSNLGRW